MPRPPVHCARARTRHVIPRRACSENWSGQNRTSRTACYGPVVHITTLVSQATYFSQCVIRARAQMKGEGPGRENTYGAPVNHATFPCVPGMSPTSDSHVILCQHHAHEPCRVLFVPRLWRRPTNAGECSASLHDQFYLCLCTLDAWGRETISSYC